MSEEETTQPLQSARASLTSAAAAFCPILAGLIVLVHFGWVWAVTITCGMYLVELGTAILASLARR